LIKKYFILVVFLLPLITVESQTQTVVDTFSINQNNFYKISSINIIPFSEKIKVGNEFISNDNYDFSYETGVLKFFNQFEISPPDKIIISYETIRLKLTSEYQRRSLVIKYDDKLADTIRVLKKPNQVLSTESIFGKNIQKSGALVRGFTVGTNSDFTLNSGLRLQLSGKLSDDIELVAALTDENTPIQAEGNTETLEELDKVFIEIKHKNAVGTFGDFELTDKQSEFSQLTRKLQGLKGEFIFDKTKGTVVVAGSRGKFNSSQFSGSDGNQGPYRLYGINNEKSIILIAGSEKVYLDGELLSRGENKDYVIDYSNSEITFTAKRLITSVSRISVDYEYTDQNYNRNFYGANFSTNLINDKLKIGLSYYRESDDEKNPVEISFSDDDKMLLQNAGDNRSSAVRTGVSIAEADSLGNITGIYSKVDTVINSESFSYYKYLPGEDESIYEVSFTYVGSGYGDYDKVSIGNYKFVGIGSGSYMPVIYLPLPELKQVGSLYINSIPIQGINLNVELSGSSFDENLLSNLNDDDNTGYARKISIDVEPREIKIGNTSLGKIGINLKDRFIESRYNSLDRIDEVEFSRYYNLTDAPESDQILREVSLNYTPVDALKLISKYGYLKQSEDFISERIYNEIKYSDKQKNQLEYVVDYVTTKNSSVTTDWNKQNGKAAVDISIFRPGLDFLYENKNVSTADSLLSTSYRYVEAMPNIQFSPGNSLSITAGYSYREEYFPLEHKMELQSKAFLQKYSLEYRGIKEFSTSLDFTFRNKNYTQAFTEQGYTNNETILFLSQSRTNLWNGFVQGDIYYQAATEQTAVLEKVFVKVETGTGSYIYLGDLNENGIAEESEFQLTSYDGEYIVVTTQTDELYPVIDLKMNTRWKLSFEKIITGKSLLSKMAKAISTETSWRVEENSKAEDTRQIYLMNLSKFLNDSTTVSGSQVFQNDFNLFQNSNDFSIRLRYLQRKNLSQYSTGIEKGFYKERGIRVKVRLIKEITNQTEFINETDNLISPEVTNRARTVSTNDLSTEFSYRPINNVEFGFKILTGTSNDSYPQTPTKVDINSVILRLNISFQNLGRLRFETERTELNTNDSSADIPFEITQGNVVGKNYFWRVFFDYKIMSYIQTSVSYDGRLQGKGRIINTLRAEAKAYF
jgi:hypothetical protein